MIMYAAPSRPAAVRWFVLALTLHLLLVPAAIGQETKPGPVAPASVVPEAVDPGQIWCAAFAPDGRTIATVSGLRERTGQVLVWDAATGRARFLRPEKLGVRSATFSPDGKTLAVACYDGTVKLLDPAGGKERAILRGHKDGVNAAAFSPDGKTLASASLDGTVKLWELASGKELQTLAGHPHFVLSVAYAPDGKTLATAGGDPLHPQTTPGEAKLWDAATGKERLTLSGFTGPVEYVTFSPDGKTLATASWDGTVKLWDPATGKEQAALRHKHDVLCVRFSPDGKTLAIAGGHQGARTGAVEIWDVASRRELATLPHPHLVWSVQFSPDGRTLLTACWDKTAKLWELAVRKERAVLQGYSAAHLADFPARAPDDLWKDLASPDAARAYRAMWALVEDGKRAVPFVQEQAGTLKQKKAAPADPERVDKLIAMLDADAVADRDKATDELTKLGKVAEPALRKALDGCLSAEAGLRVKVLLDKLSDVAPDTLRWLRAVEMLEYAGTAEARQLLTVLAKDAPKAPVQEEAKASLERLGQHRP